MQLGARGESFDGFNFMACGLDAQHQARAHGAAVDEHTARTAIASQAAFLAAGHSQYVAQDLEQALARLAQKFHLFAVDRRLYYCFMIHVQSLAVYALESLRAMRFPRCEAAIPSARV